jgi:hypothetical protein
MMSLIPQHLDLTPEQITLLSELTLKTSKSPQEVVDDALRQYSADVAMSISNGSSLYDRLARDGLIGSVDGLPTDLSTNPQHMEGFGGSY